MFPQFSRIFSRLDFFLPFTSHELSFPRGLFIANVTTSCDPQEISLLFIYGRRQTRATSLIVYKSTLTMVLKDNFSIIGWLGFRRCISLKTLWIPLVQCFHGDVSVEPWIIISQFMFISDDRTSRLVFESVDAGWFIKKLFASMIPDAGDEKLHGNRVWRTVIEKSWLRKYFRDANKFQFYFCTFCLL